MWPGSILGRAGERGSRPTMLGYCFFYGVTGYQTDLLSRLSCQVEGFYRVRTGSIEVSTGRTSGRYECAIVDTEWTG